VNVHQSNFVSSLPSDDYAWVADLACQYKWQQNNLYAHHMRTWLIMTQFCSTGLAGSSKGAAGGLALSELQPNERRIYFVWY